MDNIAVLIPCYSPAFFIAVLSAYIHTVITVQMSKQKERREFEFRLHEINQWQKNNTGVLNHAA